MKNIIIIVIALVVIGGGSYWYMESVEEKELEDFANATTTESLVDKNKVLTMEEVSKHNKKDDCWMVIDKDVLDVTGFVDKHPGGEVILQGCGKDASSYFHGVREHVKPLVKMLYQKMIVGRTAN